MKDEISALRENVTNLVDSVRSLNHSVETMRGDLEVRDSCKDGIVEDGIGTFSCGDTEGWRRIAYLNMTEPGATCPAGWQVTRFSNAACGRVNPTALSCDSVVFPLNEVEYSQVCGRIRAYSYGGSDAFYAYNRNTSTIDEAYLSGVSITHGRPRQHVWSFAAGLSEGNPTWPTSCPCDATIPIRIPHYVGDDYFCESGVNTPWEKVESVTELHMGDVLWDGQNCSQNSTCCDLNGPPYFTKSLPGKTMDDIEARICLYDTSQWDNFAVEFLEFYVK